MNVSYAWLINNIFLFFSLLKWLVCHFLLLASWSCWPSLNCSTNSSTLCSKEDKPHMATLTNPLTLSFSLDICCACPRIFSWALWATALPAELCPHALGWLHVHSWILASRPDFSPLLPGYVSSHRYLKGTQIQQVQKQTKLGPMFYLGLASHPG